MILQFYEQMNLKLAWLNNVISEINRKFDKRRFFLAIDYAGKWQINESG